MRLQSNDPMLGFYDRVVTEGKNLDIYRKIPVVSMIEIGESFDMHAYKKHCVESGYGSQESVDILWPEPKKEEKNNVPE